MKFFHIFWLSGFLLACLSADAQQNLAANTASLSKRQPPTMANGLVVTVLPPKIGGQKALVQLKMKSNLSDAVESARAVCFLLDNQGKMIGHATKWVIGQNKHTLEPNGETTFNFVVVSPQRFTTTNLTARVSFSRVVLSGGKLINPNKDVTIINESR